MLGIFLPSSQTASGVSLWQFNCEVMANILDGICSNTPIFKGIDDWPRSASTEEWFCLARELFQSVIVDMDLEPDS